MAYSKKTWKGRLGTGLNKYVIGSPDESGKQTITSDPDTITQEGDALSANNLNDLENRIDGEFTNVNNEITKFKDGTTVAKKAEGDEDGTNIKSTYAKKADYVPKADIVDGLSSSDATKVLSAKQGKALNDAKANKVSSPVTGDVPKLDANGDLVDSGIPASNVAQQDGYYEGLTAGNAEQLIASVFEEDKTPYNFRTSGGSIDIGDREYKRSIVGGTIMWNQQFPIQSTTTLDGITFTNNGDGSYTINGTAERATGLTLITGLKNIGVANHKVLSYLTGQTANVYIQGYDNINHEFLIGNTVKELPSDFGSTGDFIRIKIVSGAEFTNYKVIPQLFDLTAMFGSTIADYIYALETANAGAGVAWFKKYFPKSYYAYNAGTPMSVNVVSHDTIEFNQWDEVMEEGTIDSSTGADVSTMIALRSKNYIPIVSDKEYYCHCGSITISGTNIQSRFYDANFNYIGYRNVNNDTVFWNGTFIPPVNACYMRFTVPKETYGHSEYQHDICINISWDGERDGEYEPYKKNSYPLDISLELRGIPKLDASNNLYYDGDVYEPDGTVTRKYGVVDLRTLNFTLNAYNVWISSGISNLIKRPAGHAKTDVPNMLCAGYEAVYDYGVDVAGEMSCDSTSGDIAFKNDSTTTPPTGILIYELATPTTEEAAPYTELQIVDDFGTEEFVDYAESQGTRDVAIPVGHNTDYQPNLRAKLEMIANNPDDDGKYILQMDSGVASYVTFPDPDSRLDDLEEIVASTNVPTTQGTYVLTCTVDSEGAPTFSWEAQS